MILNIDKQLRLELTALNHAEELYKAVDSNRPHLSAFLPWVNNMQSLEDYTDYILHCEHMQKENKEISFAIRYQDVIVGRVGLYNIDHLHKNASIGYWLTEDVQGKGIISRSCETLIAYAFEKLSLNRLEIKATMSNGRSLAIPERLGFTKEGIQRQAEYINNVFVDLEMYSLLKSEWDRR